MKVRIVRLPKNNGGLPQEVAEALIGLELETVPFSEMEQAVSGLFPIDLRECYRIPADVALAALQKKGKAGEVAFNFYKKKFGPHPEDRGLVMRKIFFEVVSD